MIDSSESYQKLKIPELKKLLHDRSLAISGNKADLIERLVEHDKETSTAASTSTSTAPKANAAAAAATEAPKPAAPAPAKPSQPAAAALAAGGIGKVANPTAVPNQKADVDPSSTKDLAVNAPSESPADTETAPTEPEKPAVDYSIGLAQTDAEKELERRKARAAKFGIVTDAKSEDEAAKALAARAKRFGTGAEENMVIRSLDQALPERGARKRDRTETGGDSRGGKRGRSERGGRTHGRGGRDRGDAAAAAAPAPAVKKVTDDPEEKRKAEQRAKKFGLAT